MRFASLTGSRRRSLLVWPATVLVLITFILSQRLTVPAVPPPTPELQNFPSQIGTWQGTAGSFDHEVITALRLDDWTLRRFQQDPDTVVWLYIGYYADLPGFANAHSPRACYPAQGWKMRQNGFQQIDIPGRGPILVNKLIVQKGLQQRLVLYWHQQGATVMTEQRAWLPWFKRWRQILEAYRLRFVATVHRGSLPGDRALVRVSAPIRDSVEATLAREIDFIQNAFPLLVRHLAQDIPIGTSQHAPLSPS